MNVSFRAFALAASCALAVPADASCGAAFCIVNTDWATQATAVDGGLKLDLRYEHIDLDQPRFGRDRVGVGEVHRHHDEVETRNRNWVATAEWNVAPLWALSIAVPYVDRTHAHVHNHQGRAILDTWEFRGLGDVRVQVRHAIAEWTEEPQMRMSSWGAIAGVKLPTGRRDRRNGEGLLAERTLQPGTGTTDAMLGAYWHSMSATGWSWFARVLASLPRNERDGFKPGKQLQLDGGARYAFDARWAAMLQLNAVAKSRDRGAEAEPEDSGQVGVFASPGLSFAISESAQLYAFYQRSVYQRVNGVQLTADWSALAGVSWRF